MKADNTRSTYKREKHYNSVRMQQGRVQLDADWNEQIDITNHRIETETKDIVGDSGAPMHHAGFHIVDNVTKLTNEEKALEENQDPPALQPGGDFFISGGRYYVDGILCQNEHIVPYTGQPDLPDITPVTQSGTYLAYLDVWMRHITALEDPNIREKALNGPDTATRARTLSQVKLHRVGPTAISTDCSTEFSTWVDEIAAGSGEMAAQAEPEISSDKPCIIAPGAGYRRLENQLYRVEVHKSGIRGVATFKWSRDNGSIVTKWEKQDVNILTVTNSGRDKFLKFAVGQWVELTDDDHEMTGELGTLVQLQNVKGQELTINPATATGPVNIGNFSNNPKIRRWDSNGVFKPMNSQWKDLEDGIQVNFSSGTYNTGDYWLIPARTANADIEWPKDDITKLSIPQPPHGILHHFCRLGILKFNGTAWTQMSDCRDIFPPLTELTNLFYVSGDGQEAMPGKVLPKPLQIGVSNGEWPVSNAKILLNRLSNGGALQPTANSNVISATPGEVLLLTDENGIAECGWKLDNNVANKSQQIEAALLDAGNDPIHIPIRFTANLSIASQVYYDSKGCPNLINIDNVQSALERLSGLTTISHLGGDGQEALPETPLPQLLKVSIANKCGPVKGAKIRFAAQGKGIVAATLTGLEGASSNIIEIATGADGIAGCAWMLENNLAMPGQELIATIIDASGRPVQQPDFMRFTANITLEGNGEGGGCFVTVGNGGRYKTIEDAFKALDKSQDVCIALLQGNHAIKANLLVNKKNSIRITGCTARASIITIGKQNFSLNAESVLFQDFGLKVTDNSGRVNITGNEIIVERCTFTRTATGGRKNSLITISPQNKNNAPHVRWENNRMLDQWFELPKNAFGTLTPAGATLSRYMARGFKDLSIVSPYGNKKTYANALKSFAEDIQKLPQRSRTLWFRKRPLARIKKLPPNQQKAINTFYTEMNRATVNLMAIIKKTDAILMTLYTKRYGNALNLDIGIGGWLKDNVIEGYLSLYTGSDTQKLRWEGSAIKLIQDWANKNQAYIAADGTDLHIRGNTFYGVRTNADTFMQIIATISNNGIPTANIKQGASKSITVTENIFLSTNNSFIGESIVMSGNRFSGIINDNDSVGAFILGYSGVFTGNIASQNYAQIQTILHPQAIAEAANLMNVI